MAIQRHVTQERIGFLRKEIGLFLSGRTVGKAQHLIREVIDIGNDAIERVLKGDRQSLVDFTYASGMLSELIRDVPAYLHKNDLLDAAYGIVQDPAMLSHAIMHAYYSNNKTDVSLSLKAVELGGVLTNEAIGRILSNKSEELEVQTAFPIGVFTKLVENMALNGEASLRDANFCPGNQFNALVNCASEILSGRHYREMINHMMNKADIYNSLSTKKLFNIKSPSHFLEIALNARINVNNFAYINKISPELFESIMNSEQFSVARSVMSGVECRGLDISDFPKHREINNDYCMNTFMILISGMRLTKSVYNGLSKHWKSSDGVSLSTAALTARGASQVFREIKSHRSAFSKFLDEMLEVNTSMSEIKYNSDFTLFYKNGLEMFESLYISPERRIFADETRMKNYYVYGLLVMGENSVIERIRENPERAANEDMLEAIYCILSSTKRSPVNAKLVLQILFDNKDTRHVFTLMHKKMHDLLMPHVNADEDALRAVNWKDSAIKREYINNDMGL